jgi:phage gp29-like protein
MHRDPHTGLYLPASVRLAEPARGDVRTLQGVVASRARSWDSWALSTWLPNPDPILKGLGRDIEVYRDLRSDGHIAGCIRRRKAAVLGLEPTLERGSAGARVLRDCEAILRDLDTDTDPDGPATEPGLRRLISEALDGALYGYQPLEVTWGRVGRYLAPVAVGGRPPEWFRYDSDNRLRFRSRDAGAEGELLPGRKCVVARQEPSYANPYGLADLSLVFWPASFRKAGSKWWSYFVEKYGGAFLVGKLPRTAKPEEYDDLTERLEAMIQDAVAAIPDDGSVEIVEAAKAASTDAHERYLLYWRGEITIALLGSNQAMETDSTRASSASGLEVADDIRDGDARLVEGVVNQLLRWTCEVNGWGPAPEWSLRQQEEIDEARPRRDKTLVECGVRFSRQYWRDTYDLADTDIEPEPEPDTQSRAAASPPPLGTQSRAPAADPPSPPGTQSRAPALAEADATPTPADQLTARLAVEADAPMAAAMAQLEALLAQAAADGLTLAEARNRVLTSYPDLDRGPLAAVLGDAVLIAEAAGRSDVEEAAGDE